MKFSGKAPLVGASIVALTALLAACGGGGGATTPPTGGGTATPPTTATPSPTPSAGISGALTIGGTALANAQVVYTCGCSAQAGLVTTDGSGNFTIGLTASPIPASPSPTYTTVPGRNYMIIGFSPTTHAQAWTMEFLGKTPATNLNLVSTDPAGAAASLYIFAGSANNADASFDDWNFNTISAWAAHLRTGPTAHETQLVNDVTTAQAASGAAANMFPTVPAWNPDKTILSGNATVAADIAAVKNDGVAIDPLLPTPCPLSGGSPACVGAPTP